MENMSKERAFKKVNGRPPKITDEKIAAICNAMRAGAYVETAAAYCGISKDTLHIWLKHGREKPNSIYGKFIQAVDKAWSDCDLRDLMAIEKAINPQQIALPLRNADGEQLVDKDGLLRWIEPQAPNVSAAQWRIARRNPKQWARTEKSLEIEDHSKVTGSKNLNVRFIKPENR